MNHIYNHSVENSEKTIYSHNIKLFRNHINNKHQKLVLCVAKIRFCGTNYVFCCWSKTITFYLDYYKLPLRSLNYCLNIYKSKLLWSFSYPLHQHFEWIKYYVYIYIHIYIYMYMCLYSLIFLAILLFSLYNNI